MTPKRRAAINLSCFFFMPLLQQIPADADYRVNKAKPKITFDTQLKTTLRARGQFHEALLS